MPRHDSGTPSAGPIVLGEPFYSKAKIARYILFYKGSGLKINTGIRGNTKIVEPSALQSPVALGVCWLGGYPERPNSAQSPHGPQTSKKPGRRAFDVCLAHFVIHGHPCPILSSRRHPPCHAIHKPVVKMVPDLKPSYHPTRSPPASDVASPPFNFCTQPTGITQWKLPGRLDLSFHELGPPQKYLSHSPQTQPTPPSQNSTTLQGQDKLVNSSIRTTSPSSLTEARLSLCFFCDLCAAF